MTAPASIDQAGAAPAAPSLLHRHAERRAAALNRLNAGKSAQELLADAILEEFRGRIALVSSFGAESAALLHLVAEVDPSTPVLFLETGMLFPATLAYQKDLAERLGLTDVRLIRPDPADLRAEDPDGALHQTDPDACCDLRKTRPLERALAPFDAWITGRKRFQSAERARLEFYETDAAGRIKLNPLADWDARRIRAHMEAHDLPLHPLATERFPSLGCAPCTTPVAEGEDPRAGRWRGRDKTECGIHIVNGNVVRRSAA
ncbi:phosphoadenylyl-sulfate reductase [Oceanicella actignis]|uniref:Adenosine 5'-phosphosulfate reductase n=1 Tax=Oceanicella actignis TaxID=1189325 RepID=A0A1M7TU49_9RHOB|nr:phosphoadenylyl-sulfate reductase [Oceanicella actignis]SES78297.1 phosphoadenylylsulfate reductase (thioredoxin) [Oceanicella actignis]SHN74279.1 phosphoadenosine phosphosulfate reductase [Oceanicella actignis]